MNEETARKLYEQLEMAYAALSFPMSAADKAEASSRLELAMEMLEEAYGVPLEGVD